MSIAGMGMTQAAHTLATSAAGASSAQGSFSSALQGWLGGQSTSGTSAAQTASLTEPGRGTPSAGHHHHAHRPASGNDGSATSSGQATAGAQSGTNGTSGSGQQTPGGVLLDDMMRGLQAYGATATLT